MRRIAGYTVIAALAALAYFTTGVAAQVGFGLPPDRWFVFGDASEFRALLHSGSGELRILGDGGGTLASLDDAGNLSATSFSGAIDPGDLPEIEGLATSGASGTAPVSAGDGTLDMLSVLQPGDVASVGDLNTLISDTLLTSSTNVEGLGTAGANKTVPISNGAGALSMGSLAIGELSDVLAPTAGDDGRAAVFNAGAGSVQWRAVADPGESDWPIFLLDKGYVGATPQGYVFETGGAAEDRITWPGFPMATTGSPTVSVIVQLPARYDGEQLRAGVLYVVESYAAPDPPESVRLRVMGSRPIRSLEESLAGPADLRLDLGQTVEYSGPGEMHVTVMDSVGVDAYEGGDYFALNLRRDTDHEDDTLDSTIVVLAWVLDLAPPEE